jgi:hypothetical protein
MHVWNFRFSLVVVFGVFAALMAPSGAVRAVTDGRYTVDVLVDGMPLPEYFARNGAYIEALRGRDYAIRLTNRTPERVAVALAVDGLNSIDARRTTAAEGQKWILGPWESVVLSGWQTSGATARRFVFTTEPRSYGAWLGRTDDLGVITAAFFRQRQPVAQWGGGWDRRNGAPAETPRLSDAPSEAPRPSDASSEAPRSSAAPSGVPLSSAAQSSGGAAREESRLRNAEALEKKSDARLSDDFAATGIGGEMSHPVEQVFFDHEPAPAATLQVRYEYREALVRLGILPDRRCGGEPRCAEDPLSRREHARGFEGGPWAPDPWRR